MTDIVSQLKRFILYAGDIIIMYAVLALVLGIRYAQEFSWYLWDLHVWPFSIMFVIWLLTFYISGLYDTRHNRNGIAFYSQVLQTLLVNTVVGVIYFYAFSSRFFSIRPQLVFLLYLACFSILFLFWRRLYNHFTENALFTRNVLCVGDGADMDILIEELEHKPYLGYRVVDRIKAVELQQRGQNLQSLLQQKKIDTVVTSLELNQFPQLVEEFYKNLFLEVSYVDLPTFYEQLTGRIPVATIGQLWFLENISESEKKYYEAVKRFFEIVFTFLAGVVGIALTPPIALAIKLNSSGPLIFSQIRVGKHGKTFRAMKFRTMFEGSETNGPQWTKNNDPRITSVGRWLRKTKLDEIPQLINILKGEMSYIGPRPEQPEFVTQLTKQIPYYNERHLIKPGLTGWAQIHFPKSSATVEDTMVKLQYDLYYIKNRSLLLDVGIILKTLNIILTGQGR